MLQLKEYQERSLTALETFCKAASTKGASGAFFDVTGRNYLSVPHLPELPYVCLRVPTGGGKTLMACHALGMAAHDFLQTERAVCLWLVPSNAILDQTLNALQDRRHPYRQAVESRFAGPVSVMNLTEALYVQRSTLAGETSIIVSTLAALRVEDTEGRKVYESAGALQHHFSGLAPSMIEALEKRDDENISFSLANVLRLHRPIIIMDEAHNARTKLSFETLARLSPSCILEFTATPETTHKPDSGYFASNVLHHCSAAELKSEHMIKLPVKLRTRTSWQEVLADAVQTQKKLEELALAEEPTTGDYLRPIVLHQAQPNRKDQETLTVEVIKKALMDDFKVPEEQIAIATGQTRELDAVDDLFSRNCPIRHIITVQALGEGWDCPFAYVLCSVAELSSKKAVEQILGRVLRMPKATRRPTEDLNCAYAFAASQRFVDAAKSLRDALIDNGFQKMEAEQLIATTSGQTGIDFGPLPLFDSGPIKEVVEEAPDLTQLPTDLQERIKYDDEAGTITVSKAISEGEEAYLTECFKTEAAKESVARLCARSRQAAQEGEAPSRRGQLLRVPVLAIRVGTQLQLFDESHFLDYQWELNDADATLSEGDFPTQTATGQAGEIDVTEDGQLEVQFVENLHQQMMLLSEEWGWTQAELVNWLDRQIPHPDLTRTQSTFFINRIVEQLIEGRGFTVEQLARRKFRLRDSVRDKIGQRRHVQSTKAFNQFLFETRSEELEVDPEFCFAFGEDRYSPNWYYEPGYRFKKHFFPLVGELKSEGEEFDCAVFLDQMDAVEYWVRNLERRPESSFWLQTSTDRFYPDFVAKLTDGRILVVEYKGADRWSNDDSREKRAIGDLWAARSDGKCLFVMPKGPDWGAIAEKVGT